MGKLENMRDRWDEFWESDEGEMIKAGLKGACIGTAVGLPVRIIYDKFTGGQFADALQYSLDKGYITDADPSTTGRKMYKKLMLTHRKKL